MHGVFTTCTVMWRSGAKTGMITITTPSRQRATRQALLAARPESTAGAAGTTTPGAVAPRSGTGLRRTLGAAALASAQFWPVQLQASKRSAVGVSSARARRSRPRCRRRTARSEAASPPNKSSRMPSGAGAAPRKILHKNRSFTFIAKDVLIWSAAIQSL